MGLDGMGLDGKWQLGDPSGRADGLARLGEGWVAATGAAALGPRVGAVAEIAPGGGRRGPAGLALLLSDGSPVLAGCVLGHGALPRR